jgi:hypothetical protein
VGIIKTPEGEFALFQNPKAKSHAEKFQRLAQGDEINGWQLKEIQITNRLRKFMRFKEKFMLTF